jgi:tetratricopeptide (TPR) repeat protein
MTPRAKRDLAPLIHEIGWRDFQRLSNELFSHEPQIAKSEEYGIPGQRQHGIDLLALVTPEGLEVAQCKCESSLSIRKIQKASDEFFKHWTHWKDQGIRRFILFAACEVERTQLQNEMLKQRARFRERNISYELWGATTIRNKLRPYRTIARTYIDSEEIVNTICGPVVESAATTAGIAVMTHRLGIFSTELEELRGEELEDLRELSRSGEQTKALIGVKKLKDALTWQEHTSGFRSRVLRFEAAVHLNLRLEINAAARLLDEARQLDPNADFQTIDAYLAYCRRDIGIAIDLLEKPKTAEARNLRWNLLLESGNLDALAKETLHLEFPADAETHRILTFFALQRGDIDRAQIEVAKAIELGSTRRSILLAKAKVDYFSSLSPAAEGMKRVAWAVPVSWTFVKRDASSSAALHAAETAFVEGARHLDCPPEERENLQVWRLACVSCIDNRQDEATDLVRQMLAENPASYGTIAWALHRGYSFDHALANDGLRKRIEQEPDDINAWLALWTLVWRDGNLAQGEAIVDEAEQAFRRTGNGDLWLFHKIQFVTHKGNDRRAKKLVQGIADTQLKRSAEIARLRVAAGSMKGRKALAESLADEFAATGGPRRLFECCELKLRLGDFEFIAQHAKQLVEGIGTAAALRLALEGVFKHGDHELCLSLLQEYRHFFRDSALSPDVRNLKAICQHHLGDWPEAVEEAAQMYHEQPSIATFSAYFDLLLRSGDTRRCSALARDLLTLKNAKPDHWLRAASVVRLHDPNLAKELWRLANRRPIKNLQLAGFSLELAFALGVPHEAETLFKRLCKLARQGRGPLREQSIDETIALFQARRESADNTGRLYAEGAVPVHMVVEHMNWPMVLGYHAQLEANRGQTNLLHSPILFARSGARTVESGSPQSLFVDITSLLLANDLGILDKVEEAFSPIYVSPHITESLMEQVTRLHPPQPERQEARQKFLEMVRNGRVAVVELIAQVSILTEDVRLQLGAEHASLLEHAAKEKGVMLHDGPFLAEGSTSTLVVLPPSAADHVAPLRKFYNSLRVPAAGGASELADGTAILLPHSIIASLPADKIEAATKRFRMMVSAPAVRELEAETAAFESSQRLADWTQALLDRLQNGLAAGNYRVVRIAPRGEQNLYNKAKSTTKVLYDALIATGLPDGVTWCDDRLVNGHFRAGGRVVVGISEVLQWLKTKRSISAEEFFDALLRLRESNIRYLPLATGEIEHHLTKALVKDGRVSETPALAILRRYINACMLDRGKLQTPLVDQNGNMQLREYEFPMGLRRAIDSALQATWKDQHADLTVRTARADWLLEQVYFDLLGIRQTFAKHTGAGEVRDIIASSLGMLYGEGIGLEFWVGAGRELAPRQAFFNWLNTRFLQPLTKLEPALVSLVAKVIGDFIVSNSNDPTIEAKPEYRRAARAVWARFIYDLPSELQDELDLPVAVRTFVGLTRLGFSVKIGDRIYGYEGYWQAMAEAVNGREGRVRERDKEHELRIRFAERQANGRVIVEFVSDDPSECGRFSETVAPVLHDLIEERIRFMQSCHHWFDCPIPKRLAEIQRLAAIESPEDRFEAVDEWRKGSAEVNYRRLAALFSNSPNFKLSDLTLPNWERLPDHLRVPLTHGVDVGLPAAADALYSEEGLFVALYRMTCLPVKLPMVLEARWLAISKTEAEQLFAQLLNQPHSIVADLHLLRLAALRDNPKLCKRAEEIAAHLLDPTEGRIRFNCFKAVLKLVDAQFNNWSPGRMLAPWVRLACIWYHASRLHGLLRHASDLVRLTEWVTTNTNLWTGEILARETVFWGDLARPSNVSYGNFILHGMARLLGEMPSAPAKLKTPGKFATLLGNDAVMAATLRIELACRTDFLRNNLGSLQGQATSVEIARTFGNELKEVFASVPDEEIGARLEELAKAQDDPALWAMMSSIIGEGELPLTLKKRLIEILQTVDFKGLAQSNDEMLGPALTFACHQAQVSGDSDLIRRMEETVIGFAPLAATSASNDKGKMPRWMVFANTLISLAVVPGNEDENVRRFFDLFRRFVELCPPAASQIGPASMQWGKRLPLAQQVNLWPFIFAVRALS